MSSSVRPNRWQPSRLPRPWDSPGKNTGVGCHFLLQCMKVKSESEFAQLCPALRDPMDFSLPGSSIHGIFQVRILEWGAIAFSSTAQGTYQYSVLPYMGKESEKEWMYIYIYILASLVAQMVKNLPVVQTWVGKSPGGGHGTPVFLPGESHGQKNLQSMGSERIGHD